VWIGATRPISTAVYRLEFTDHSGYSGTRKWRQRYSC